MAGYFAQTESRQVSGWQHCSHAFALTSTAGLYLQMKKSQDNLSKEMKQRLRQEYYGLGGAENKVGVLDHSTLPGSSSHMNGWFGCS